MNNRLEYDSNDKVHPETIPTVEKTSTVEGRVGVVKKPPTSRETVTTTTSTPHSHSTKSKEGNGPSLPILAALLCCIPLAGILGYLVHEPKERVVTRTVTNTVPVLTVPASPVVDPSLASPAPLDGSSSPVGPAVVGPSPVGPAVVGPKVVGPARVGIDRVGKE